MGRNKLKTLKLTKQASRNLTYRRRNVSLFKKAIELGVICNSKVSLIMCNGANNTSNDSIKTPITYFHNQTKFESLLEMIKNYSGHVVYFDNSNYNDICSGQLSLLNSNNRQSSLLKQSSNKKLREGYLSFNLSNNENNNNKSPTTICTTSPATPYDELNDKNTNVDKMDNEITTYSCDVSTNKIQNSESFVVKKEVYKIKQDIHGNNLDIQNKQNMVNNITNDQKSTNELTILIPKSNNFDQIKTPLKESSASQSQQQVFPEFELADSGLQRNNLFRIKQEFSDNFTNSDSLSISSSSKPVFEQQIDSQNTLQLNIAHTDKFLQTTSAKNKFEHFDKINLSDITNKDSNINEGVKKYNIEKPQNLLPHINSSNISDIKPSNNDMDLNSQRNIYNSKIELMKNVDSSLSDATSSALIKENTNFLL